MVAAQHLSLSLSVDEMLFHLFDQINGAVKELFLETLRKDAASHAFVRALDPVAVSSRSC